MRFLRRASRKPAEHTVQEFITPYIDQYTPEQGDWHPVPGFGNHFGDIDPMVRNYANHLGHLVAAGECINWARDLCDILQQYRLGRLMTGLTAAVLSDLGFQPRAGAGLYQLMCAPGLLAHGLEYANKPLNAVPFVADEHYHIESR